MLDSIDFQGPEVVLENPCVDFGLVKLGELTFQELTVRNDCQIPAKWRVQESPAFLNQLDPMVNLHSMRLLLISVFILFSIIRSLNHLFLEP